MIEYFALKIVLLAVIHCGSALIDFNLTTSPNHSIVRHEPNQPKPEVPVLVTAQCPKGTIKATLKLQAIVPGKYVRKSDPAFEKNWAELPMRDDGKEGDAKAEDGIFTVQVPASYQRHRWLIRYRIETETATGSKTKLPSAEDNCPNFAWWCDAGPATWNGTRDPGKTQILEFSTDFLSTLQSIYLLANSDDVARSQWDGNAHKQKQQGTIVYQGVVYDHIQFSNRGQASAHMAGKNKWSLKFNRGHELPFVDHAGKLFGESINSLNLNPGGSTPHLPVHRGIAGMDEVLSMRAYRLAGVPSPPATWIQWRVVDHEKEVSTRDQYAGDLWGLYVAIGEMTPNLLADQKLPDGLVVSIQSGIKHTPQEMNDGEKVWEKFVSGMRTNPTEAWWRQNLDLKAFFSFHALNRLLANVDLRPDGNHGYYRNPDGRWSPIPWDNDMMFVPRHHQPGYIDAIGCLNHPKIALEYRNRAREILDLFATDSRKDGGHIGQLTYDLAQVLTPKGFSVDWPRLDEAKWNQNPRMNQKGTFYINPFEASHFGGAWKRQLETNDFAGFCRYIVDFCTDSRPTKKYAPNDGDQRGYGWGYLNHESQDPEIPATPTVKELSKADHRYQASEFTSPKDYTKILLVWRVGKVGKSGVYELVDYWNQEVKTGNEVSIPAEIFKDEGSYRVRARWKDSTGRCSHWSNPIELTNLKVMP